MLKAQTNQMYWQCHAVIYCCPLERKMGSPEKHNNPCPEVGLLLWWWGRDLRSAGSESRHYVRGLEWTQKGQKKQRKKRNKN